VSALVQALPSSQGPVFGVCLQPPLSQVSSVQGSPSSQDTRAPPMQAPAKQWSAAVQLSRSVHRLPSGRGVFAHSPLAGSQALKLHWMELSGGHSTGVGSSSQLPSLHTKRPLQRLPSSSAMQSALVVQFVTSQPGVPGTQASGPVSGSSVVSGSSAPSGRSALSGRSAPSGRSGATSVSGAATSPPSVSTSGATSLNKPGGMVAEIRPPSMQPEPAAVSATITSAASVAKAARGLGRRVAMGGISDSINATTSAIGPSGGLLETR
jgi:hypothetical protein